MLNTKKIFGIRKNSFVFYTILLLFSLMLIITFGILYGKQISQTTSLILFSIGCSTFPASITGFAIETINARSEKNKASFFRSIIIAKINHVLKMLILLFIESHRDRKINNGDSIYKTYKDVYEIAKINFNKNGKSNVLKRKGADFKRKAMIMCNYLNELKINLDTSKTIYIIFGSFTKEETEIMESFCRVMVDYLTDAQPLDIYFAFDLAVEDITKINEIKNALMEPFHYK